MYYGGEEMKMDRARERTLLSNGMLADNLKRGRQAEE